MGSRLKALLLGAGALAACAAPQETPAIARADYSAQLYTLRAEAERDGLPDVLRRVADLGYGGVEFAGLYGENPVELRALMDELGLRAVGNHVWWEAFRDAPEAAIAETKALGAPYLILAWLPEDERDEAEEWKAWAEALNRVGAMAARDGVRVAYHNHDFEFQEVDGVVPYDLLLERLDPALVDFQLDMYWATLAGRNPRALVAAHPGRFPLSHVKDMAKSGEAMVDVGDGRIGYRDLLPELKALGMREFTVEHDTTDAPYRTLERSLDHLSEELR